MQGPECLAPAGAAAFEFADRLANSMGAPSPIAFVGEILPTERALARLLKLNGFKLLNCKYMQPSLRSLEKTQLLFVTKSLKKGLLPQLTYEQCERVLKDLYAHYNTGVKEPWPQNEIEKSSPRWTRKSRPLS
ncbi:MAG: hypothetical protein QXH27_03825 [Candidatus Micrarchaeia archaeon]